MIKKQAIPINFAKGVDKKTDPWQLTLDSFTSLVNSVFTIGNRLTKRNGYASLAILPAPAYTVTTFNNDLTAIGLSVQAYSFANKQWIDKGSIQPLSLNTFPLIRNNLNQSQVDAIIAPNGLICTVYTENNGTTNAYKYVVADSETGQNIIAPTILTADATYGTPKVFVVGKFFVIIYVTSSAGVYSLSFIAVSYVNTDVITTQTQIGITTPATTSAFDGAVLSSNGNLYLAWNGGSSSGIKMATISPNLALSGTAIIDAGNTATLMSVCTDSKNNIIWASYYNTSNTHLVVTAVDQNLNVQSNFPNHVTAPNTLNIASVVGSPGKMNLFIEVYDGNGNFISTFIVDQVTGGFNSNSVVIRSLGIASKPAVLNGSVYILGAYSSTYQPTYFLINTSLSLASEPNVIARLAYENGGGYLITGLPTLSINGSVLSVPYLYKDLIEALSNANSSGTVTTGGIYSQTGINLATFDLGSKNPITTEIGANLNISGGFLWAYDGYQLTEQGFHLYPDNIPNPAPSSGGSMFAQKYYYQFTYEWTDNQGNAFRSAGSIPILVDLTGSGYSSVVFQLPTLRITAKTANPVKIVGYRWSTANPEFYQCTSITAPLLNDTMLDYVPFTDTQADSSIIGKNILYTMGGVVEDIGGPACSAMTLFDDRLWLVDAEDQNLLWYSKQVIESTPVEMSDLFTMYVAPSIGATGPTGPISTLSAMDDKLIIFKNAALYYINGTGPDNTGSNSQYSQPTFITSMVGCSNPHSIIFQPQGLMFEFTSEAGNQIWMLGRDLSTQYIGAPIESLTQNASIVSAIAVPGTNQVRFNLSSGITLMYDYFYGKWGTFTTSALSSTLYQGLHTYITQSGAVYQETPGKYLDGTSPVLMSFITAWINPAGLHGYLRSFFFYLLGKYITPFKLMCSVAYDYQDAPIQNTLVAPTNFIPAYGAPEANGQYTTFGQDSPYGGNGNVFEERVFLTKQRCSAFQLTVQEVYDSSFGVTAGEGLTISGMNLVVGIKSGFKPISAANSSGSP